MAYPSYSNPFGFMLTPWVRRLLIANGVMFILLLAFGGLEPYLAFIPSRILTQPWTLVTYMFVHRGFLHVFFNMLVLFFFGPVLEERWGSREFLKFYLLCGLGAAALSMIFPNTGIVGASGAVYGLMVAFAVYWPESPIHLYGIFPIKAKWLVGGLVALSVLFALSGGRSGVAHLAHLGGALTAFVYLKSRLAPSAWGQVYQSPKPAKPSKPLFARREKTESAATATPNSARTRELHRSLDDVDRILDKISRGGMASLTPEERARLEEASRKFRSN
ncbi:MAG TPA: rhomboid family intramembrane serine protease [Longimicrobiaceae bacterium]